MTHSNNSMPLTKAETQALNLLSQGLNEQEIADCMEVSLAVVHDLLRSANRALRDPAERNRANRLH